MSLTLFSQRTNDTWDISVNAGQDACDIHRTFDDGLDVILKIRKTDGGYSLSSSAECRTSGPNDDLIGIYHSIEEAAQAAEQVCREWEQDSPQ